jgi:hypothetical protein
MEECIVNSQLKCSGKRAFTKRGVRFSQITLRTRPELVEANFGSAIWLSDLPRTCPARTWLLVPYP